MFNLSGGKIGGALGNHVFNRRMAFGELKREGMRAAEWVTTASGRSRMSAYMRSQSPGMRTAAAVAAGGLTGGAIAGTVRGRHGSKPEYMMHQPQR